MDPNQNFSPMKFGSFRADAVGFCSTMAELVTFPRVGPQMNRSNTEYVCVCSGCACAAQTVAAALGILGIVLVPDFGDIPMDVG
jgi:hypothetical protein